MLIHDMPLYVMSGSRCCYAADNMLAYVFRHAMRYMLHAKIRLMPLCHASYADMLPRHVMLPAMP